MEKEFEKNKVFFKISIVQLEKVLNYLSEQPIGKVLPIWNELVNLPKLEIEKNEKVKE